MITDFLGFESLIQADKVNYFVVLKLEVGLRYPEVLSSGCLEDFSFLGMINLARNS